MATFAIDPGADVTEVHPADPIAKRCALLAVVLLAVTGFVAYALLTEWLAATRSQPTDEAIRKVSALLLWSTGIVSACAFALGLYFLHFGHRVKVGRRFPPANARMARPTAVLRDRRAWRRAVVFQVVGGGLVLLSPMLWLAVHRLIAILTAT